MRVLLGLGLCLASALLHADSLDVVIEGGRVMDPETGLEPSSGMRYVLVNGQLLIDQGRLVDAARPGKAVRP